MQTKSKFDIIPPREKMKKHILFFIPAMVLGVGANAATTCSRANLTRCLDSACAINVSSNPAARCQYCGTSNAGTPPSSKNAMRSVSVGTSAKYNISDKDLKKAPTDPGERYAWATSQCIKKVAGCSADDVTDVYDSLIEQSCKAAGISSQMANSQKKAAKKKSENACESEIKKCLIADKHCTSDYRECETDSQFDKYFSACSVDAAGCDDYVSKIRKKLIGERDNAIKNADKMLTSIVENYQSARDAKIKTIKEDCADKTSFDDCVATVCQNNMHNKCDTGYADEKSMAIQLCKFHEIACATID